VMLAAAGTKCPSYPSVRRYLKAQGLLRQRPLRRVSAGALAARDRLEQREVRSYEVEHVLQLMHLDFHHGSRKVLTRAGEYVKPLLGGFIDDPTSEPFVKGIKTFIWFKPLATPNLLHSEISNLG
jgi:putative transposase